MTDVRIKNDQIDFGNLTGLIGTWMGANGFNLIAVPDQNGGFTLLVAPYTETLVVNAVLATTPNRGLNVIENIPTLQYSTKILDLSNNNSLMHVENGFWERTTEFSRNGGFDIFKLASIPHGDTLVAMGVSSVIEGGPMIDTSLSGLPTGDLPTLSGYTDVYFPPFKYTNFSPSYPNLYLENYLKGLSGGLKAKNTVQLKVSTQNKGGINNIASLKTNANATQFDATFWIVTFEDLSGNITKQLLYSQRTLIKFPIKSNLPGQTIVWPHINVNILKLMPESD